MRQLPKWLAKLIAALLPKQENSGERSVQVGKAGGDVTVVNFTQHVHQRVETPVRHWQQQSPPQQRPRPQRSPEQVEVLALMRQLRDEAPVLDFMQRAFKTRRVIELTPPELYRVKRYVETIQERDREKR